MRHQLSTSLALYRAQIERARPSRLLGHEHEGHMSPQVREVLLLMDLLTVVGKIGKSKSNAFKVKSTSLGHAMQASALGHQLLECLPGLGLALSAPPEVRFDPRIEVAVTAARDRGPSICNPEALRAMMLCDPWTAANVLNGFVDQLRHLVNIRAFIHQLQRHKDKQSTGLRDLVGYFKRVAMLHPTATVMRLELRAHQNAGRHGHCLRSCVASLDQTLRDWLRRAESAYGEAIVAHAWKIDLDSAEGFFAHVVLAIDGPQGAEIAGIERSIGETWRSLAGEAAYMLSCKGEGLELEYRGGRHDAWNYSLNEELCDAAIFLAGTDSLFAWDVDGKPPTHGRGRMPQFDARHASGRARTVREVQPRAPTAFGSVGVSHERQC